MQVRIKDSEYAVERQEVAEIFEANRTHRGLQQAITWVTAWMTDAVNGVTVSAIHGPLVAAADMRRLSAKGVTAEQVLIEVAALWIHQQNNRHKFLSQEAEDMAIGLAVLGLAPQDRQSAWSGLQSGMVTRQVKPTRKVRRELGPKFTRHLYQLFTNLKDTLDRNRDAARTEREEMAAPLAFPVKLTPFPLESK